MAPYILLLLAWPANDDAASLERRVGPLTVRWHAPAEDGTLRLRFADRLRMSISAEGPEVVRVQVPRSIVNTPGWREAARGPEAMTRTPAGSARWQRDLFLEPLAPRDGTLEFGEVLVRIGEGEWRPFRLPSVGVRITTDPGDDTPRDITAIETVPEDLPGYGPWPIAGLVLVAVLVAVAILARRRTRRPRVPEPARDRARGELDRLARLGLLGAGKRERYFTLLSAVLRRYLEKRHAVPARQRTTEEFLRLAGENPALAADLDFLRRFLSDCDTAKFAPGDGATGDQAQELRDWLGRQPP